MPDEFIRDVIPDESAIIRGAAEEGIKGEWEDIFHPEETRDIPRGERIPGGGKGIEEVAEESVGALSAETRVLLDEFCRHAYGVSFEELPLVTASGNVEYHNLFVDFRNYLSDKDAPKIVTLKDEAPYVPKSAELLFDPNECPFDFFRLQKLWSDPETRVTYRLGGNFAHDRLLFENEGESAVVIPMPEIVEAVKRAETGYFRFTRPIGKHQKDIFESELRALTLERDGFAPREFEVAVAEVDLTYNENPIRTTEMRKAAKRWLSVWNETSGVLTINLKPSEDSTQFDVITIKNGGKAASLPMGVWKQMLGLSNCYLGVNGTRIRGVALESFSAMPGDDSDDLEMAFSRLKIDGKQPSGITVEVAG